MTDLTQEQKLALRLKDLLKTPGLHKIEVYVTPELVWECWFVETKKPEGLPKATQETEPVEGVVKNTKDGV